MQHTWINYPNKQNQKCTRCGMIKENKGSKTDVNYKLNDTSNKKSGVCSPNLNTY